MPTQEQLLEAEARGLLPPNKQAALDELRRRGQVMSREEYEVKTGRNQPDYRPQSTKFQRISDLLTDPLGLQDEIIGGGQFISKLIESRGDFSEAGEAYTSAAERVRAEKDLARRELGNWGYRLKFWPVREPSA